MKDERTVSAAVLGGLLAIGLVAAGAQMARAVRDVKAAGRYVTVRGLSEREVPANLAMWPIVHGVTGSDLARVQADLDAATAKIETFLERRGFEDAEISVSSPRVTDFEASGVRGADRPVFRYAAQATMTLRSTKIAEAKSAIKAAGELVASGVALTSGYGSEPTFSFTALDAIKPAMIAEATKDARRAAEQFANDSGSRVGVIRSAQQGYFAIEDRDAFSPDVKKIRVVTTVEYFLED